MSISLRNDSKLPIDAEKRQVIEMLRIKIWTVPKTNIESFRTSTLENNNKRLSTGQIMALTRLITQTRRKRRIGGLTWPTEIIAPPPPRLKPTTLFMKKNRSLRLTPRQTMSILRRHRRLREMVRYVANTCVKKIATMTEWIRLRKKL